jgi:hypothetical protein
LSLGGFLHDAFHFQTHLDNKLVKTVKPLLTRPGQLTLDWIEGRRVPFAKPIQLFVVLNLVFFLLAGRLGIFRWSAAGYLTGHGLLGLSVEALEAKRLSLGLEMGPFVERLDHAVDPHKKWVFLILIPMTALVMWAFHPRRRLVEHLVFAIHHATMLFLVIIGVWLFMLAVALLTGYRTFAESFVLTMVLGSIWLYATVAIRRVYGTGWPRSVGEAMALTALLLPVIGLARWMAYGLAFQGL